VLPEDTLWVTCLVTGDTERTLRFEGGGDVSRSVLAKLRAAIG